MYKQYRNTVSNAIRRSKREYYHKLFDEVKSNLKGTWKVINNVLNKTKKKSSYQKLRKNNVLIENNRILQIHLMITLVKLVLSWLRICLYAQKANFLLTS